MRLGIPGGLFYYRYEPFIKGFFNELGIELCYSVHSGKEILDLGSKNCVDEACFPMKLYHGHVKKLAETCDFVTVPRIMKTEYGESICPKFCGLPELVSSGADVKEKLIFTAPIELNKGYSLENALKQGTDKLGVNRSNFKKALHAGRLAQSRHLCGLDETGYKYKVLLAGHPYNVYDKFANLNLIEKLHKLDIGVITEERIARPEKEQELKSLLKKPYWAFFVNVYGASKALLRRKAVDGIICVSSFSCGTDAFTIEMIKNVIGDFPMLVLKLDDQTGEAGYDTRLEAFSMVLEAGIKQKIRKCR